MPLSLMTLMCIPFLTNAALPWRAGMICGSGMTLRRGALGATTRGPLFVMEAGAAAWRGAAFWAAGLRFARAAFFRAAIGYSPQCLNRAAPGGVPRCVRPDLMGLSCWNCRALSAGRAAPASSPARGPAEAAAERRRRARRGGEHEPGGVGVLARG